MAAWTWTAALAAFRQTGDGEESRKLLAEALASNAHVPAYLLGERRLPKRLPPFISPGKADEAVHYVAEFQAGWARTPGAIDWLRARAPLSPRGERRSSRRSGPR
jgi:hypothetical protein